MERCFAHDPSVVHDRPMLEQPLHQFDLPRGDRLSHRERERARISTSPKAWVDQVRGPFRERNHTILRTTCSGLVTTLIIVRFGEQADGTFPSEFTILLLPPKHCAPGRAPHGQFRLEQRDKRAPPKQRRRATRTTWWRPHQEELRELVAVLIYSVMHGRVSERVLDIRISPVHEEEQRHFHVAGVRSDVERRAAELVPSVAVRPELNQLLSLQFARSNGALVNDQFAPS